MRKIFGAVEINNKGDMDEIIPFVGLKSFVGLSSKMKHQDYCYHDSTYQTYEQCYKCQAGSGLPGFQRGHNWEVCFRDLLEWLLPC